jgi:FixJ family two-component response regulator
VSNTRPLIAVIEADATDRRTLCNLLSSLQVDVRGYDSAESYLSSDRSALDCLITDVELPGMSGLELLRLLRSRGVPDPVILLGAEEDVRAAVTAMREGAIDFIEKSNVDLAILRCVSNVIERHDRHPPRPLARTAH